MTKEDRRVRTYHLPTAVLYTAGEIHGIEHLFEEREKQIGIQEPEPFTMISTEEEKASILLDFGVERHGGVVLSVLFGDKKGTRVHLSFGESAAEAMAKPGKKGACNDHSPRDFTVTLSNLSTLEYGQTGFRFLRIDLPQAGKITFRTIQAVSVMQPYEVYGSFECSDEKLNKIFDTAAYTCRLCLQDQLWDGIKRDRLVWIGDMAPEEKTIRYLLGEVPQIESGLTLVGEQSMPPKWANTLPTYSLWWLIVLDEWCFYIGKDELIFSLRDQVAARIRQILDAIDENGTFVPDDFVDWPTRHTLAARAGTGAIVVFCLEACIRLSQKLGEKELAAACRKKLKNRLKHREEDGGFKQINALLLLAGLGGDKDALARGGAQGMSTFMSYFILSAMARFCGTTTALDALKEYYGAMLDLGATSFWEDFDLSWKENAIRLDELPQKGKRDLHGDNGKFCYVGYRHSLCHGWSSGPVPFLIEEVLGVHVTGAGCKTIVLRPHLGSLSFARGSFATPKGKVTVSHSRAADGSIKTTFSAPRGVRVTVEKTEE